MKEIKDCEIIRDLFPSYIDALTKDKTNQYIEKHLKECEECGKVLENMRKELKLNTTQKHSKEVKYIKKFSNKMKILKTILLVIVLVFVVSVGRKMVIIANLNNKISNYTSSTNYYMKQLNYFGDDYFIGEYYKKDDKYTKKSKFFSETANGGSTILTEYYNGKTVNTYMEGLRKVARLNKDDNIAQPIIPNGLKIYNPFYFIVISAFSSIRSEECNEKDCYRIVDPAGNICYIEKETGLVIRTLAGTVDTGNGELVDAITDFQYEFDVVTDEDFIEPDISEYEIQE